MGEYKELHRLLLQSYQANIAESTTIWESDLLKINIGKIGSIPLILIGLYWTYLVGFGGFSFRILRRPIFSFRTMSTIFIDIALILICLGIWLPRSKLRLYLGRIGSIIWIITMGYPTLMIFGELEHADTTILIIYFIIVLSTIVVTISLWKPRRKRKKVE